MLLLSGEDLDRLSKGLQETAIMAIIIFLLIIFGILAFLNRVSKKINSKEVSNEETKKKNEVVIEDPIVNKLNNLDSKNNNIRSIIDYIVIILLIIIVLSILIFAFSYYFKNILFM